METLSETIAYMNSESYQDRFKAEYYQLNIRIKRLEDFLIKVRSDYYKETETVKCDCPIAVLEEQLDAMSEYKRLLLIRAEIENINL